MLLATLIFAGCGKSTENSQAKGSYSVVDCTGYKTEFTSKPKRVLCYNLTYDTILLGLVPSDCLVGKHYLDKDSAISYISEETKHIKEEIRWFKTLSQEAVTRMAPEVIFASDTVDKNTVIAYRNMGIKVIVCKGPYNIQDIKDMVRLMAKTMQAEPAGEKVVAEMDRHLKEVADKVAARKEKAPVVMLVSRMKKYGGKGSVYDEMCKHAGIINAISKQGLRNGEEIHKESVIAADPDVFLVSAGRTYEDQKDIQFRKEFLEDPAFKDLKGLKRVVGITDRYTHSHSQNVVFAIKGLYNSVYGPTFDMSEEKLIKGY